MSQAEIVTSNKKLKPPQKEDIANWVSDALHQLQEKSDMIKHSFVVCGISGSAAVHPSTIREGQQYPDTEDETGDNTYDSDEEELDYVL